jgi:hypothetical protein
MIPMDVSPALLFPSTIFILFLMTLLKSQSGNGCRHASCRCRFPILLDHVATVATKATRKISPIISTMGSGARGRKGGMMVATANLK